MALSLVKFGVDNYHRVGVPPHKLVLTFPFYGYVFNVSAATVSWAVPVADSDGRPLLLEQCADNETTFHHGPNQGCRMGGWGTLPHPAFEGPQHWAVSYDARIDSTFLECVPPSWWSGPGNKTLPKEGPMQACSVVGLASHAVGGLQWDGASSTPWFRYVAHAVQLRKKTMLSST